MSTGLSIVANSGSFTDLLDVPAELSDGDDDTLGGLTCAENEVPRWDGSSWICTTYNAGIAIIDEKLLELDKRLTRIENMNY